MYFLDDVERIFERCGGLAPFDCSDTAGISARWERWIRAFELLQREKESNMLTRRKL